MKYLYLIIISLYLTTTNAQEEKIEPQVESNLYALAGIEAKPEFPGGIEEFYKFIGQNYRAPKVKGLKGKVFVTFIIEKDGTLSGIKVLRDIGHGTGEEAIRVLKRCPAWKPGEQKGEKVRVQYSLPITIQPKI